MIKVRVQVAGDAGKSANPFTILASFIKNEGVLKLYKGLDSALVRQATYTTTRFGVFLNLMDAAKARKNG